MLMPSPGLVPPAGLESIHFFCDQAHARSKKEVLRGNMFKTCRVSFSR